MITFSLCPRCDTKTPAAHGLLAYFAVHTKADGDTAESFAVLLAEWLASLVQIPRVSQEAFDADVAAYRRGEFE